MAVTSLQKSRHKVYIHTHKDEPLKLSLLRDDNTHWFLLSHLLCYTVPYCLSLSLPSLHGGVSKGIIGDFTRWLKSDILFGVGSILKT